MLDRENDLNAWDRDHFFHPSTHMGAHARGETPRRVIAGGEGCTIVDTNGKRSLDAFAGLYCVNVGYGRTEIADAIAEQARELGANAVVGIDIDYEVLGEKNGMLMVSASGTAVVVAA